MFGKIINNFISFSLPWEPNPFDIPSEILFAVEIIETLVEAPIVILFPSKL